MNARWVVQTFRDATSFLDACETQLLSRRSISANFALATSYTAAADQEQPNVTPSEASTDEQDYWFTASPLQDEYLDKTIPIIALAIVGKHAGRLASSIDPSSLSPSEAAIAMHQLVQAAERAHVPRSRILGVIGPAALSLPFADAWGSAHGVRPTQVLHFALAHVTRTTLRPSTRALAANVVLGPCAPADLDVAAVMCERATHPLDEPVPPPLDAVTARAHAERLIDGGYLYGARVDGTLCSLVSITRETPSVRAISKVYTEPEARGQGLAEGLVHYAIARVFEDPDILNVCLFFDPSNPDAVRLYRKIGFSIASGENEEWAELTWGTH